MPLLEGLLVGLLAASVESLRSACKGVPSHKGATRPTPKHSRAVWLQQGCPASGLGWPLFQVTCSGGSGLVGFRSMSLYSVWWCSKRDVVIYEARVREPHSLITKHISELVLCSYFQTLHLSCVGARVCWHTWRSEDNCPSTLWVPGD